MKRVTQRQAEQALRAVQKQFKMYLEPIVLPADEDGPELVLAPLCPEPKLSMDWDGHVAILWEDGPSEWAFVAVAGGASEEDWALAAEVGCKPKQSEPMSWPKGVIVEPYFSFVLCLYPA